jgi:hypothetical protein
VTAAYLIENLINVVEEITHLQYVFVVKPRPFPISPAFVPLDDIHPGQSVLAEHVTVAAAYTVWTSEHGPPFAPVYPEMQ